MDWESHAVADHISVSWSFSFSWTLLYIHIELTTCILNSDMYKILFAPDCPEHNYSTNQGVSV